MNKDIEEIILSEDDINALCKRIGAEITKDYAGKEPLFIGYLKGALPFMTELLKRVDLKCTLDYLRVKSYEGTESTGNVKVIGELPDVKGKDVIIVEDILDTGTTLSASMDLFKEANSVKIVVLLDKFEARKHPIEADYVGLKIPKKFVVGFGLDYNENYRNLPYVGVLKKEVYM